MPAAFLVHEQKVQGPATHAVVIGIGHYPHLPGGGGTRYKNPEGMGQLTSPPYSARAFATWLIEKYNYPAKPLAKVALLVSQSKPAPFHHPTTGKDIPVEPATMDTIEQALAEWRDGAKATDRLIFYFCGHGLAKPPNLTLLAEDFGAKSGDPLNGAFDFNVFQQAMGLAIAGEQVYFVDACRNTSASLVKAGQAINGRPVFTDVNLLDPKNDEVLQPTIYATLRGASAYARPNQESVFSQALLQGLSGAGAVDEGAGWRVTTLQLQGAVSFMLKYVYKPEGRSQLPASDNQVDLDFHIPVGEPKGLAVISCAPAAARRVATLTVTDSAGQLAVGGRETERGDWLHELIPGDYEFLTTFAAGGWKPVTVGKNILPVGKVFGFEASK